MGSRVLGIGIGSGDPRAVEGVRWMPVAVDLDRPLSEVATDGADALLVTVFAGDQPLGRSLLPALLDPMPIRLISDHLEQFMLARQAVHIRDALTSPGPEPPTASVIVCTRDRPEHLERCLSALAGLEVSDVDLLVVNNGPNDAVTRDLTDRFGGRYFHEPVPGLDRARNRGLLSADTQVVLFVDDDVTVTPRWASHLLACFDDPLTVAATGLVLPDRLDDPAQIAFERYSSFVRGWERKVFDGGRVRATEAGRAGAGASLAFRRETLLSIGGFAEELDAGRRTESGGDTYALYRALRLGYRVVYEPKAVAYHSHRDQQADLERTIEGYGTGVISYFAKAARDDGDAAAVLAAMRWGIGHSAAGLVTGTLWPGSIPTRLVMAEAKGMLRGLSRLASSRRLLAEHPPHLSGSTEWIPRLAPVEASLRAGTEAMPVTIVVPTRNRRESVLRLLDGLEAQDYPTELIEVVVTVDADTDGTAGAIENRAGRRVTVVAGRGEGAPRARNRGAARASGEVILFLDDDIEPLDRGLISAHVRALASGNAAAVGAIHPRLDRSRLFGRMLANWWTDMATANRRLDPLTFTDVCAGNLSISAKWFRRLGGFSEIARREDWLLGWQLLTRGGTVGSAIGGDTLHYTSDDPAEALEDRISEGQGDVDFIDQFPEAYALLPLSSWDHFSGRKRQIVRHLVTGTSRSEAVHHRIMATHERFERLGLTDRASGLASLATQLAYWSGVASGAGSERRWHELVSRGRRSKVVGDQPLELTAARSWSPPPPPVAEVPVTYHGIDLGVARIAWGGIPWSRPAFADAMAHRFAPLALEVEARTSR